MNTHMRKILSLILLVTAACGGSPSRPVEAPAAAAPSAPTAQLGLGEIKLIDVDNNQAILIHADGTIELGGKKPGKVTPDGTLISVDTGEVVFKLSPDGAVTTADGKDLGIKLGADGAVTRGDKTVSIGASGELVGGDSPGPKLKIEGATDAKLKRTAMFVLIALTTPMPAAAPAETRSEAKPGTP